MQDKDGFQVVGKKYTRKIKHDKKDPENIQNHWHTKVIHIVNPIVKQNETKRIKSDEKMYTMHAKNTQHVQNDSHVNDTNKKRILCYNMFTGGTCPYNNGCVYAHSLEEQKYDPIRKRAYGIICSSDALDKIDLIRDGELYVALSQLTKVCYGCENHACLGGVNCKNGAINTSSVICFGDLNFGKCTNLECNKIHLTKRGLTPYKLQDMLYNGYKKEEKDDYVQILVDNIPPPIELSSYSFPKLRTEKSLNIDDETFSLSNSDASDVSDDECVLVLNP
jgi:hypothetical protein